MEIDYDRMFDLAAGERRGQLVLESPMTLEEDRAVRAGTFPGPVPVLRSSGRTPFDFISAGPLVLVVSPRVLELLERIGATGWSTAPIETDHGGLEGYAALAATGRCGDIDDARSERAMSAGDDASIPMPVFRGRYFINDEWDGSDVFTVPGGGFLMVTSRVVEAFAQAKLTNVAAEPLTAVERPDYSRVG